MGQLVFNTIDQNDKTPRVAVEFDTTSGVRTPPSNAKVMLIIGQMLAAGTQPVNVAVQLFRPTDSEALFGAGSVVDVMAKAAFTANPTAVIWAVAVVDPVGGVAASETITYTGPATADGGGVIYVNGTKVSFAITNGDTPTIIAASAAAALNAIPTLPVSAASALGVVTVTSKQKGTVCNGIQLQALMTRTNGVTATHSNPNTSDPTKGNLSTGAGVAALATAFASVTGARYHDIAIGLDDAVSGQAGQTHVESQGDAEHQKGEFAIQAFNGVVSAATTMAAVMNGKRNLVYALNNSPSWSIEIAAAAAAVMSGETVATRPYNTLPLLGIKPPPIINRFLRSETKALLAGGVSPLVVLPGEVVAILRAVSTYVKNTAGNADYTLFDVTIMQGLDYTRDSVISMFQTLYARSRWADSDPDGLFPSDVATPAKVTKDLLAVARVLESQGILQNVDANAPQFVVNKVGTTCQFSMPSDVIDGLHEIFGKEVLIRQPLPA